jgi:adenylate cyclase class IV
VFNLKKRVREAIGCACWMPRVLRKIVLAATRSNRNFEVERKFSVSADEHAGMPDRLLSLGFRHAGQVYMIDTFLPTDVEGDMCRVREESENDRTRYLLTHKTWVEIDGQRERDEEEEAISRLVKETLLDVGKRAASLLSFSKERELFTRAEGDRKVTVSLDVVEGLGEYSGTYMEIELLVSRKSDVAAARESIQQLAAELLGEERPLVQLSYMEMLKRTAASQ